jgi:ribonuclease HI
MNLIEAWFDGVCEPKNPGGHAAYGVLVKVNGVTVLADGGYVGEGRGMSNNVAEYAGCLCAMQEIEKHPGVAIIRGDSKLVIYHLVPDPSIGRKWKVNGGAYMPYHLKVVEVFSRIRERVTLEWITRDDNGECDRLSKKVLHDMGVKFRIQPEQPERRSA